MTALPLWLPEVVRLLRDGECAWPEGEAADPSLGARQGSSVPSKIV
jgi:hypothetical protein